MNKNLRTLLCLLLSLVLLCGLCACGGDEELPPVTKPTADPATYDPMDSYHVVKDGNGKYSFTVTDYADNVIFSRDNEPHEPQFAVVSDGVLQVVVPQASNPQYRWAVFCDVRNQRVSNMFGNFLGAKGNYVAQLEYLTDQYHVFVRNIFGDEAEPQVITLTGLVINKNGSPYESAEMDEDGKLVIVYETKDGKKTATVNMAE